MAGFDTARLILPDASESPAPPGKSPVIGGADANVLVLQTGRGRLPGTGNASTHRKIGGVDLQGLWG